MPADPKPRARIVNPAAGRDKIRLEGCRLTGTPAWAPPGSPEHVDRVHLVGKGAGGDDVDDNIIGLRHDLHMRFHSEPGGREELGPRIWEALRENERAYVLQRKSGEYVRRYFAVEVDEVRPVG